MNVVSKAPRALALALIAGTAVGVSAQTLPAYADSDLTVVGTAPTDFSGMEDGPQVEGLITARSGDRIQVTSPDGTQSVVALSTATEFHSKSGLFNLSRTALGQDSLANGLPVKVKTVQWGSNLLAKTISFKDSDLKTAAMIRGGTAQGFAEQTAATEALRGRLGDIDQYNIKSTTNVNFDVGKANLSDLAKADLCSAAAQAEGTDNALLLVVGYTDSTGPEEFNQELSEKRAGRVVNYLQQACGWKPYRMLTPTGMAEADPLADNATEEGKAQNRRVAVNILVSKSVDGI